MHGKKNTLGEKQKSKRMITIKFETDHLGAGRERTKSMRGLQRMFLQAV